MKQTSMQALRKLALRLPGTEEGVACAGTALEARTIRAGSKAFLFLRPQEARLKLDASLKEAAARASKEPGRYVVGKGGWVLIRLDDSKDALEVLGRWIAESHGLFAAKKPATPAAARGTGKARSKPKKSK